MSNTKNKKSEWDACYSTDSSEDEYLIDSVNVDSNKRHDKKYHGKTEKKRLGSTKKKHQGGIDKIDVDHDVDHISDLMSGMRLSRSSDLISKFKSSQNPIIEGKHIFGYDDIYPQSARDLTEKAPEIILTMKKDDHGLTGFDYAIKKNWMWVFELTPPTLVHEATFHLFVNSDSHHMKEKIMYEHPKFQSPSFVEMALNLKDYEFERLPRETKGYIQKNAFKFSNKEKFQKLVKSMIRDRIRPEIDARTYNLLDLKDCCPDFLHSESYFQLVKL